MRRVTHGDLVQLARAMLMVAPRSRRAFCAQAFHEAEVADAYRQSLGQWHPDLGDGTLTGWASPYLRPPEPILEDREYLDCLIVILTQLRAQHGLS